MKKRIDKVIQVDASFCNICEKEIEDESSYGEYSKRIEIVKFLFKTADFDAHQRCINGVVKEAFKKFIKKD